MKSPKPFSFFHLFLLTLVTIAPIQISWAADKTASVEVAEFGSLQDGSKVHIYTLTNSKGLEAEVMTYGATLRSVRTPDRDGNLDNITLYLDSFEDYEKGHPLLGSVVGRFANRIKGAQFFLDGQKYEVSKNAGENHIHGGPEGFQKQVWDAKPIESEDRVGVVLTHTSPDGHAGYPGNLKISVTYELSNENELIMLYTAETDKPTHLNLTNHAYWNLAGAGSGDVFDHILKINADHYVDSIGQFPTGVIASVEGSPLDFRKPTAIGERVEQVEGENYDHCYVLNKQERDELSLAAEIFDPSSGRFMSVYTTQPGVQLYTAKHLSSNLRAGGKPFAPYHGLCLETQHFPDSPNIAHFPSTVLHPGEIFVHKTVHRFEVK